MKKAGDFGRSRCRINNGKTIEKFDSKYLEIDLNEAFSEDGQNKDGDFIIEQAPKESVSGKRYVKGDMMRFHKGVSDEPDNQDAKYTQDATYVNIVYTVATSILEAEGKSKIDDEDIEEENVIGVCIPIIEYFSDGKDKLKENLEGAYVVRFPALDGKKVSFDLDADNIKVSPEGVIALSTVFKDSVSKNIVASGLGAIIDGGYGSLDIALMEYGRPVGKGARSFPIGGITLKSKLESVLESNNIFASEANVESALKHGEVARGKGEPLPVGEHVQTAKKELAKMFIASLKKVLIDAGRADSELKYFFVMGRCFKTNQLSTRESVDQLVEAATTLVDDASVSDRNESEANTDKVLAEDPRCTGSLVDYIVDLWKYDVDVLYPIVAEKMDAMEDANAYGLGLGMFRECK